MSDIRLVCVPFAGAGASFYSPWRSRRDDVTVCALQLPGRENRIDDPPCTDLSTAVDHLVQGLFSTVGGGELVLFGHSLGAALAFEFARRLEAGGTFAVRHLVVSGSAGPFHVRQNRATGKTDEEFLLHVRDLAGYEHPALADPELRELVLPTLRADVQMHEEYRAAPDATVRAPITALRGADDHLVSAAQNREWAEVTEGDFRAVELPGGHMYLVDAVDDVLALVAESVASTAGQAL